MKENFFDKKIIYVVKDKLHQFPPCISQVVMLCKLGIEVCVIAEECDETAIKVMETAGAQVLILGNMNVKRGLGGKVYHWVVFALHAKKKIKQIISSNDIIWCGTEGTAIALGYFLKRNSYVLTVLELYDTPFYKNGVGHLIGKAKSTIACEKNRARVMKQWYGLEKLPYVMPNKPQYEITAELSQRVKDFKEKLNGKKYILYQGVIEKDRSVKSLANALNKTKEYYELVIIGKSAKGNEKEVIEEIKSIYTDVSYGGFFPAPQHLHITEGACIGVAFYDASSLNNMFCAPNKIFEYSKFNVPILGNDIPGLQCTVEKNGAGICVDMENPDEIAKAIDKISENYEEYQKGAERLYNSVDNLSTTKKILEDIGFIE